MRVWDDNPEMEHVLDGAERTLVCSHVGLQTHPPSSCVKIVPELGDHKEVGKVNFTHHIVELSILHIGKYFGGCLQLGQLYQRFVLDLILVPPFLPVHRATAGHHFGNSVRELRDRVELPRSTRGCVLMQGEAV